MPFSSKSQMRYMHAKHPKVAEKWSKKYGTPKNLPEKKGHNSMHSHMARRMKKGY